jgi:riboflavin transporter FmnP
LVTPLGVVDPVEPLDPDELPELPVPLEVVLLGVGVGAGFLVTVIRSVLFLVVAPSADAIAVTMIVPLFMLLGTVTVTSRDLFSSSTVLRSCSGLTVAPPVASRRTFVFLASARVAWT